MFCRVFSGFWRESFLGVFGTLMCPCPPPEKPKNYFTPLEKFLKYLHNKRRVHFKPDFFTEVKWLISKFLDELSTSGEKRKQFLKTKISKRGRYSIIYRRFSIRSCVSLRLSSQMKRL